ncbi:BrnT family toxin [uncultured Thiodictyon sp.]|uniref:BrnT family toxin n=1 Tax=uncultured Thiodictyon sp. TaxID=1846217 RepID=UPI0025E472F6|nr:BrnT family toxin [uncultured Thiodictyon sp.]
MTEFEWDPEKARANKANHRVTFEEARTIFGDPFELTITDPDHSEGEQRFLSIGQSELGRLLVVSYTERKPNKIRIISARVASQTEKMQYEPRH